MLTFPVAWYHCRRCERVFYRYEAPRVQEAEAGSGLGQ